VDHPNIVRLYEIFEDSKYIHFVMDLCTGGDLMDYLLMNGPLGERLAAEYMKKLLSAVNHMH
jgi:calcium-dependent protein kinase